MYLSNKMDRRELWIANTRHYKSKFLELLIPIFNSKFHIEGSAGVISNEEEFPSEETLIHFDGIVPTQWRVMGGYVYELMFGIKSNSLFTETADVDVAFKVSNVFANDEYTVINPSSYGTSSFFESFLEQFISRMKQLDFSNIEPELDDLPNFHDEDGIIHDFGRIRFFIANPISTQYLCQRKIQIYLSKGGVYDELFDIIFYTDFISDKNLEIEVVNMETQSGSIEVNCCDLLRLVCGDLEALGERIIKPSEKSANHIGRILYIFGMIDQMNEKEQRYIIASAAVFCSKLSRKIKVKGLELGKYEFVYRNRTISISELLESLKPLANKFITPFFIHMFGSN